MKMNPLDTQALWLFLQVGLVLRLQKILAGALKDYNRASCGRSRSHLWQRHRASSNSTTRDLGAMKVTTGTLSLFRW